MLTSYDSHLMNKEYMVDEVLNNSEILDVKWAIANEKKIPKDGKTKLQAL